MSAAAGAEYVRAMSASESDRSARRAFQELVLRIARPGALVFDFGAGPGIDARCYALRGLSVHAYEPDPAMCEYFVSHCGDLIETGQVILERGSYPEFLRRISAGGWGRADLVTANFAPLNLIPELPELFAAFEAITHEDGRVLAAVLSPYYLGDSKYLWWWRNAVRFLTKGRYAVNGASGPVIRRSIGEFAASCSPRFKLDRIYRSLPDRSRRGDAGIDPARGGGWLHLMTCRFMFLEFRKTRARPAQHRAA